MGLQPGHTTWLHMHVKFEQDLLNTSAVISKTSFEQRGCYISYQSFGPKQICQDTSAKGTHFIKDVIFLFVTSKDMIHFT